MVVQYLVAIFSYTQMTTLPTWNQFRANSQTNMAAAGKRAVNGRMIPDTPIVVDYFNRNALPPRMLFFLTHVHAGEL